MRYGDEAWRILSKIIKEGEGGLFYELLWKEEGSVKNYEKHRLVPMYDNLPSYTWWMPSIRYLPKIGITIEIDTR